MLCNKAQRILAGLAVILGSYILLITNSGLNLTRIHKYRKAVAHNPSCDLDLIRGNHSHKFPCLDRKATQFGRVEDIFCTTLGEFEPSYKNPCFYDYLAQGRRELKCIPYFYLIGPDKCGSTDLHTRLLQHPQIMNNKGIHNKEASFWGWKLFGKMDFRKWHRNETTDFYMNLFDKTSRRIEADKASHNVVTGDASPMDFWDFFGWRQIPQNKDRLEPEVLVPTLIREFHKSRMPKMIIQFRDPIERIFSLYVFYGMGKNVNWFHRDVLFSIRMLEGCIAAKGRRLCFFDGDLFWKMPVKLATSCYSVYLKEWLASFPRNAFFITRLEDTSANMKQMLKNIYAFLELEPLSENVLDSISGKPRSYVTKEKVGVKILPETAQILRKFYQPCNEELASLLQDDRYLWNDAVGKKDE